MAFDGMIDIMRAELIYRTREEFEDGAILEIVIWRVPTPVPGCSHSFKCRLYYGRGGRREIGFDNERPKGDHRHVDDRELGYTFQGLEKLIQDFLDTVRKRRQT